MSYIDGCILAVPTDNKDQYLAFTKTMHEIFAEYGATSMMDAWANDVPDGEQTSFPMAVQLKPGESVVFSWIVWPSKSVRDEAWQKMQSDPRMAPDVMPMPFDGSRMIFGGFDALWQTPQANG